MCEKWFCLKCTDVHRDLYKVMKKYPDSSMKFNCPECVSQLPKIKQLLTINGELTKLTDRVSNLEIKMETSTDTLKTELRTELTQLVLNEVRTQMQSAQSQPNLREELTQLVL